MSRPATIRYAPNDELPARPLRRARAFLMVAIGVLLTPLIYDGTMVLLARWQSLFGPTPAVETPFLDALAAFVADTYRSFDQGTTRTFRNVPWSPSAVLGLGFAWVVVGCRLLMRGR